VWARKGVATEVCPKSYVTPQSLAWLEAFFTWKLLGGGDFESFSARQADAFWVLESELAKEKSNAQF
jgi:hypothetical protein